MFEKLLMKEYSTTQFEKARTGSGLPNENQKVFMVEINKDDHTLMDNRLLKEEDIENLAYLDQKDPSLIQDIINKILETVSLVQTPSLEEKIKKLSSDNLVSLSLSNKVNTLYCMRLNEIIYVYICFFTCKSLLYLNFRVFLQKRIYT
jgi:DNA-directed RNA polymerase subunit L